MKSTQRSAWLPWAITLIFATLLGVFALSRPKAHSAPRAKAKSAPKASVVATAAVLAAPAIVALAAAPVTAVSQTPKKPRFSRARGRASNALKLGLAMGMLGSMLVAGTALAEPPIGCTPATCTIIDFFQDGTQADYWKTYNGNNFENCEKVETSDTPITLTQDYAFLVIHSGAHYYIWQPAAAGEYSADQTTSFYVVCDPTTVEEDIVNPDGSLFGPCGDPAYAARFDNTGSTVSVRFRFRWYTTLGLNKIVKMVPAGQTYNTVLRWAKPGTKVTVGYQDPNTGVWIQLDSQTVVKGMYPMCTQWLPGWNQPLPPT